MYTVACSSCQHQEKSSFVRVGAVMICPGCKTHVQVRAEDVKRHIKLRTEGDDELFRAVPVQREEPAVAAAAPAALTDDLVMHAASELHEDHAELAAEASRRVEESRRRKPKAQPVTRSGATGAELAHELAQKRRTRTMMIGAGVAVAALVGIVLAMNALSGGDPVKDAGKDSSLVNDPAPKDGGVDASKDALASKDGGTADPMKDKTVATKDKDGGTPTKDKSDPPPPPTALRIAAMPLGIDSWQTVNEPFRQMGATNQVVLINDAHETSDEGGQVFKADVVSQGVASALVSVALVNDEDRVYARFDRPYFLMDGKTPRPVRLNIPAELIGRGTSITWNVVPIDAHVKNLVLLQDTLAEPLKDETQPALKISAYNSSSYQLKDAAFVIQAFDALGQISSQWRLKFPDPIDTRSWLKFEAELSGADMNKVSTWRVLGAGLPSGQEVAPPVIEHEPVPQDLDPKEPIIPRRRGLFDF